MYEDAPAVVANLSVSGKVGAKTYFGKETETVQGAGMYATIRRGSPRQGGRDLNILPSSPLSPPPGKSGKGFVDTGSLAPTAPVVPAPVVYADTTTGLVYDEEGLLLPPQAMRSSDPEVRPGLQRPGTTPYQNRGSVIQMFKKQDRLTRLSPFDSRMLCFTRLCTLLIWCALAAGTYYGLRFVVAEAIFVEHIFVK